MAAPHKTYWLLPFRNEPFFFAAALVVFATALFMALPGIDLSFSRFFYDPARGGFFAASNPHLQLLRSVSEAVLWIVVLALVASLLIKLFIAPHAPSLIPPRISLFLFSTLVLGPGLIVNGILKSNWGRPRPRAIDAFGGDHAYVAVWDMVVGSGQKSFVSGEASSAMWLTAIAFVVPSDLRLPVLATTVPFALAVSLNRIAFGGHFLSDILIGWGLTLIVVFALHYVLIQRAPAAWSDAVLDDRLGRAGEFLHGYRRRLAGRIAGRSGE